LFTSGKNSRANSKHALSSAVSDGLFIWLVKYILYSARVLPKYQRALDGASQTTFPSCFSSSVLYHDQNTRTSCRPDTSSLKNVLVRDGASGCPGNTIVYTELSGARISKPEAR